MKIRSLIIYISLGLLIVILSLAYVTRWRETQNKQQIILDSNLETANTLVVALDAFMRRINTVQNITGTAIADNKLDKINAEALLRSVRRHNPELSTLKYVLIKRKKPQARIGAAKPTPKANIAEIKGGADLAVSNIYKDGRYDSHFHITSAIYQNGRLIAFVDGEISGRVISDFIRIRIGDRGNLSIIDSNGRIVGMSFKKNLTWRQRQRDYVQSVAQALNGRDSKISEFSDPISGVKMMGASTPIKRIGWVANVFLPKDEAIGQVWQEVFFTLFVPVVAFTIFMIIIGFVLTYLITKPLSDLARETGLLQIGEYQKNKLQDRQRLSEIRTLSKALNQSREEINKKLEGERHIANTLQNGLTQVQPPVFHGYDIGTRYNSATEGAVVGGDFFDFVILSQLRLAIIIGDIQGKGVEASLLTTTIKFTMRNLLRLYDDSGRILEELNKACIKQFADDQFFTVVLILLDIETGNLCYSSAGHHPPIVCSQETHRKFNKRGPAIGIVENQVYSTAKNKIAPGEIMVLYTDGLVEARAGTQLFGHERLTKAIRKHIDNEAQEVADIIFETSSVFAGGHFEDDVAIVTIERQKEVETKVA